MKKVKKRRHSILRGSNYEAENEGGGGPDESEGFLKHWTYKYQLLWLIVSARLQQCLKLEDVWEDIQILTTGKVSIKYRTWLLIIYSYCLSTSLWLIKKDFEYFIRHQRMFGGIGWEYWYKETNEVMTRKYLRWAEIASNHLNFQRKSYKGGIIIKTINSRWWHCKDIPNRRYLKCLCLKTTGVNNKSKT